MSAMPRESGDFRSFLFKILFLRERISDSTSFDFLLCGQLLMYLHGVRITPRDLQFVVVFNAGVGKFPLAVLGQFEEVGKLW